MLHSCGTVSTKASAPCRRASEVCACTARKHPGPMDPTRWGSGARRTVMECEDVATRKRCHSPSSALFPWHSPALPSTPAPLGEVRPEHEPAPRLLRLGALRRHRRASCAGHRAYTYRPSSGNTHRCKVRRPHKVRCPPISCKELAAQTDACVPTPCSRMEPLAHGWPGDQRSTYPSPIPTPIRLSTCVRNKPHGAERGSVARASKRCLRPPRVCVCSCRTYCRGHGKPLTSI
jgi:hypothetical protein